MEHRENCPSCGRESGVAGSNCGPEGVTYTMQCGYCTYRWRAALAPISKAESYARAGVDPSQVARARGWA